MLQDVNSERLIIYNPQNQTQNLQSGYSVKKSNRSQSQYTLPPLSQSTLTLHGSRQSIIMTEAPESTSKKYESGFKYINDADNFQTRNLGIKFAIALANSQNQVSTPTQKLQHYTIYTIEQNDSQVFELQKCSFHYFKVKLKNRKQPIVIHFKPYKTSNFKGRMFLSTVIERPNRFNCDQEYEGQKVKFWQNESGISNFSADVLYITLFSNEMSLLQVLLKFGVTQTRQTSQSRFAKQESEEHQTMTIQSSSRISNGSPQKNLKLYNNIHEVQKIISSRLNQDKQDQEFTHQLFVRKKKQVMDLQDHVTRVKAQRKLQLKEIISTLDKGILIQQNKKNNFNLKWILVIKGSLQIFSKINEYLQLERAHYVKRQRMVFVQRISIHKFFKKQRKWGSSVTQRTIVDIYHSLEFKVRQLNKSNKKLKRTLIYDFLRQNGQFHHILKIFNLRLEKIRKVIKRWQAFKKISLEYKSRIKYSIGFSIIEIFQFLEVSRDEINFSELVEKLNNIRQNILNQQLKLNKGIQKRGSSQNMISYQKTQSKLTKIQEQIYAQLKDNLFLQNLANLYTKKHHSRWNEQMNEYLSKKAIQYSQKDNINNKVNLLLEQFSIPFLFTEIDWLLVISIIKDEFIRRGFLTQHL